MNQKTPKLTLVGAGIGDPDLITVKGIKALQDADVVMYDALVSKELLSYAPQAVHVFVGKRGFKESALQDEINELIVKYALEYGHVVRLKGGDPFVFGRGYEEILHAEAFNIKTKVVSGVTSAVAAPSAVGIPLTVRGVAQSFWVITGTTKTGDLTKDVSLAAQSTATVVILMGMNHLQEIVEIYKSIGKEQTPIAIIQNASMPNQKLGIGTIQTIEEVVLVRNLGSPAVMVIGEVVNAKLPEALAEIQNIENDLQIAVH